MAGGPPRTKPLDPEFGAWLKRVRASKKLLQREVAERAGVNTNTYTNLENSLVERVGTPSVAVFERVAHALDLDLGYVLHKAGFDIGAAGVNLTRLAKVESILETLAAGQHEIRKGLAGAMHAAEQQPTLFDHDQVVAEMGRALAAFDLITERLHEEGAL